MAKATSKLPSLESLKSSLEIAGVKYSEDASLETLIALKTAFMSDITIDTSSLSSITVNTLNILEDVIRVKIVCNNPEKRAHKGEYFGVGNSFGTIKAFIPYNTPTASDLMVPCGLVEVMKQREFLHVRELDDTERREIGGAVLHTTEYTKEFTIIELEMEK